MSEEIYQTYLNIQFGDASKEFQITEQDWIQLVSSILQNQSETYRKKLVNPKAVIDYYAVAKQNEKDVLAVFNAFDFNRNGFIEENELS